MKRIGSVVVGIVLAAAQSLWADATFTGAVSASWGEAGNWEPAGVPSSGNVTVPADKTVEVADAQLASVNGVTKLTLSGDGARVVFKTADPFTCTIAGTGEVMKVSTSSWTLTKDQPNYYGAFTVAGGVVKPASPGYMGVFGSTSQGVGPLTVTNSATLDFFCKSGYAYRLRYRELRVAGNGYEGGGVLQNTGTTFVYYALGRLTLLGDAKFSFVDKGVGTATDPVTEPILFDMNGYTLTQSGKGEMVFFHGSITNAGRHVVVGTSGNVALLTFKKNYGSVGAADDGVLEVGNYAYLNCYGLQKQVRPLRFTGSTTSYVMLSADRGWDTNYNNFAGPAEITAGSTAMVYPYDRSNYKGMFTLSGPLSGSGTLALAAFGKLGLACPTNTSPAFTGVISIDGSNGGSLIAYYPASIPDYSKLTVKRSRVTVPLDTWTKTDIVRLANTATFQNHAVVEVDTSALEDQAGSLTIADSDIGSANFGLGHDGPGTLSLFGPFTKAIKLGVHDGVFKLTGSGQITIGEGTVGGDGGSCSGTLAIEDAADVRQVENTWIEVGGEYPPDGNLLQRPKMVVRNGKFAQQTATPGLVAGGGIHLGRNSPGLMEFAEGADFSARIVSGYNSRWGNSAIRQTGGSVWLYGKDYEDNSSCQFSAIGWESFGYYGVTGGSLTMEGYVDFGHYGGYSHGVLEQSGGTVTHKLHRNPNQKSLSTYWAFGNLQNGSGAYYLRGGKLVDEGRIFLAYQNGATGIMTVEGPTAEADVASEVRVGYRLAKQASLSLVKGGVMTVDSLSGSAAAGWNAVTNCVNFDGGTLRARANGTGAGLVMQTINNLIVYAGGATFDTNGRTGRTIQTPIRAPEGQGVVAAAIPAGMAGGEFVGAPLMRVDGDGIGAVVAAEWDAATRRVTGMRIVAPGSGYKTATLVGLYGQSNYVDSAALTLGVVAGGGITKAGEGDLTLAATNTYSGATVLAGGTLKCGCDQAIPLDSQIVFAGGKLDMNGKKFSDGSSVPKRWAVDVNQVKASGTVVYDGDVTFPAEAVLEVKNLETLEEEAILPKTLLRITGTVTGEPTVQAQENPHWRVAWRGNQLRLISNRGLTIILK